MLESIFVLTLMHRIDLVVEIIDVAFAVSEGDESSPTCQGVLNLAKFNVLWDLVSFVTRKMV